MIFTATFPSPIGFIEARANDEAVTWLQFADVGIASSEVESPVLRDLKRQLDEYFEGRRRAFDVPVAPAGTAFQKRVWDELMKIGHGELMSYGELARCVGRPTGQRAVAAANGANPICILIPCHRVIGKDGKLTGYSAGIERKRFLLSLEQPALAWAA